MSHKNRKDRRRKEDCDRMTAGQKIMWTPDRFSQLESVATEEGVSFSEVVRACVPITREEIIEKLREIGRR